ncbi:MAG TPA: NAD(P)-binding domain-containing protein [Candidatus Saccharimonadia bacterium]
MRSSLMSKRVGILGTGAVGLTLAQGLQELGYDVSVGSRSGKAVEGWNGAVGTFKTVVNTAELVILAVKGAAAAEVVKGIAGELAGKTVLDTTNPIDPNTAPQDGVLAYFTGPNESLMEMLQAAAPDAHFVKCFNSVGAALMVKPQLKGGRPTMFLAGNHAGAKTEATELLDRLEWDAADMGPATAARAIEPLCMLYCIPGLTHNEWSHAFKLLQA